MCGRYTLTVDAGVLGEVFDADVRVDHTPRFNIAPTQTVPVVRLDADGHRRIDGLRWGLVPHWADDPSIGNRMINARSETAAHKPAFRAAVRRRRCLVPADGFFEWKHVDGRKQPYHLRLVDGGPFAFAGLWERWQPSPDEPPMDSSTILTTAANADVAPIHDRMPVILEPDHWDAWLSRDEVSQDRLSDMLQPYPDGRLVAVAVSTRVNSPRHDDPDVLQPPT